MDNTLEDKLKKYEDELLALKQSKLVAANVMTYSFSFHATSAGRYRITYEANDKTIITSFQKSDKVEGSVFVALSTPFFGTISGNTQNFIIAKQNPDYPVDTVITLMSTRRILSVTKI